MKYPPVPEPHTIEVEATNHCNAKCSFCPHPRMKRPKGFLDVAHFQNFISALDKVRRNFWLNRTAGQIVFPRIVFAGLGEPTLHPNLAQLVKICSQHGFWSRVITNGSHLKPSLVQELLEAGLSSLAISLHSLNPDIYQSLMGLRLEVILPLIKTALELLESSNTEVEIWRVFPPQGMMRDSEADQMRFQSFIKNFPWVKVLGPSEPWSRDNTVIDSIQPFANDNPQMGIWCHHLYLTSNIAWDGTAVMCCVDFHRQTVPLGNVFIDGFKKVQEKRESIFRSNQRPEICRTCMKWSDEEYQILYQKYLGGVFK